MLKNLLLSAAVIGMTSSAVLAQSMTTPVTPVAPTVTTTPANTMMLSDLMDLKVRSATDENVGEIEDVILDGDGKVSRVVVSVGGFLGMGEHHVALAWNELRFDPARKVAIVSMDKEQLKAAPEFTARRTTAPVTPSTSTTTTTIPVAPKVN
jgi:sporulation protein YlmC with PRC-barrel domain